MNWIEVEVKDMHKIPNNIWVKCIVEIRCNSTGEVREYHTDELLRNGDDHPGVFNWEEGNYSCDCNRHLFFKRVNDEETKEDWDIECTDGRYSVNLKNQKDNKHYYKEF